ncbi:MAG: phospholipase D-like domain-containing protein, partial [Thermoplasmata archaeon]|nr:phospholipase D-like domain-containing protein [Thermoplasmata archaeon]
MLFVVVMVVLSSSSYVAYNCCLENPAQASAENDQADPPLFRRILFDDIDGGEFFSIANQIESPVLLQDYAVTDGEGSVVFPEGALIEPGSEMIIARNADSFLRQNGHLPDFSLTYSNSLCPIIESSGNFRLSNDGDEIILMNEDRDVMDAVAFGKSCDSESLGGSWVGGAVPDAGRSRIISRRSSGDSLVDTDSKTDWLALRDTRPGQSQFDVERTEAKLTPLILPDHSNLIIDVLLSARKSVLLCSYQLDSFQLSAAISRLLAQGVKIEILIEGSPVGGLDDDSINVITALHEEGAKCFLMKKDSELMRRYSYLHAKYLIVDGRTTVIMSENFVKEVFDMELGKGNRGWGAIIESEAISSSLASLFRYDSLEMFSDVWAVDDDLGQDPLDIIQSTLNLPVRFTPAPPSDFCHLELYISPDCENDA